MLLEMASIFVILQRKASNIPNLHKFDSTFYKQAFQTDISVW